MAGILVQTLTFGMMGPGVSIATDLGEGIVDRFRTLATSRYAYLLGHLVAEMGAAMIALVVLVLSGLVVAWRIHEDVWHAAAAVGLLVLFAACMRWAGMLLGLIARSPDSVQGFAFMTVFPLTFLSNAFVPSDTLPSVLQTIAAWNPLSAIVAPLRQLFGNAAAIGRGAAWPLEHPVVASLGWCALILAAVVPLTLARFRTRTSGSGERTGPAGGGPCGRGPAAPGQPPPRRPRRRRPSTARGSRRPPASR